MTIPSNLLALALGFLTVLVVVALIAVGVPLLFVAPTGVYGLAFVGFLLGRWIGDLGPIVGNTMLILGAIVLGVTVAFAEVDLDAEDPRTLLGWTTFAAALLVPYGLYGGYRAIVDRRADRGIAPLR